MRQTYIKANKFHGAAFWHLPAQRVFSVILLSKNIYSH